MLGATEGKFLSFPLCCSCNKASFPQQFNVLGLATSFSQQLVSLQLQPLIGLVLALHYGTVKMLRCPKVCKDRNEFFGESITV